MNVLCKFNEPRAEVSTYIGGHVASIGKLFVENKLFAGKTLNALVQSWCNEGHFVEQLKKANGFYAIVKYNDQSLLATVDHARSIPLFYSIANDSVYISNDAYWVRSCVGNTENDPLAEEEFLLAGYLTGRDTLCPAVKQLQAGEVLIVDLAKNELISKALRHHEYEHETPVWTEEKKLLEELDKVHLAAFDRLIRIAEGRTLVVPLSGGYDSRAIVLMLKRLGYTSIVTFSYGKEGNTESLISKQVAHDLDVQWMFIAYDHEKWRQWFHSDERKAYSDMAHGLSAVPHIQDWPAVLEMKKQKAIPEDSIFVPGHTVALSLKGMPLKGGRNEIIKSLMKKHYTLSPLSSRTKEVIEAKIQQLVASRPMNSPAQRVSAFESWELEARQSRFIVNSVRAYEFWSYDWWLPLWDAELLKFWAQVPYEYRIGKRLYKKYVTQLHSKTVRSGTPTTLKVDENVLSTGAKQLLQRVPGFLFFRDVYKTFLKRKNSGSSERVYEQHPLAWYGVMSKQQFTKLYVDHQSIHSLLALEKLGKVKFNVAEVDSETLK